MIATREIDRDLALSRAGSVSDRSALSYRYVPVRELALPANADFLSDRELLDLKELRDSGRRTTWLAGRYLLKQLLAERLMSWEPASIDLRDVEVSSRDKLGRKTRPGATHLGRRLSLSLALSHTSAGVLAAVAPAEVAVGVDLTSTTAQLGPGFAELWFSPAERELFAAEKSLGLPAAWAIKEATYKALNSGEPFEPRRLAIERTLGGHWTCRRLDQANQSSCRITLWRTAEREIAVIASHNKPTTTSARGASP